MSNWIALLPAPPQAPATPGDSVGRDAERSSPTPFPCSPKAEAAAPAETSDVLDAPHLAWWALQFTPRVALLEDAVVMEVQASERLFGGADALWHVVQQGAWRWQAQACAQGPTALGALALARGSALHQALGNQGSKASSRRTHSSASAEPSAFPHPQHLSSLGLHTLRAVAQHQDTLARLGCRTLGDVRRLPRAGLSRRFGADLLRALDQAWGDLPLPLDWCTLPPRFEARLELPGRVDTAPGLLFAAQRLLPQLCAWLSGMQAGVTAFTLSWLHDGRRHDAEREGRHTIRLGSPSRDPQRLGRLLNEHLQRVMLQAPVTDLSLHADAIERQPPDSLQLFQTPGALGPHGLSAEADALITPAAQRAQRDALLALVDKLSVRLGEGRVLQGQVVPDHRLEQAQRWWPAVASAPEWVAGPPSKALSPPAIEATTFSALWAGLPQPCWVLAAPVPLHLSSEPSGLHERPLYQGPLQLLAGPHRIEAGWWDDTPGQAAVARDYYLASSAKAGLLWVYKTRTMGPDAPKGSAGSAGMKEGPNGSPAHQASGQDAAHERSPWFLHGFFA
jgi:protein ImuB